MENNHLSSKEIGYILSYKDPIDKQLNEIEIAMQGRHPTGAMTEHLISELCMFYFTLGREYERQHGN